jgi:hypothetical protein
VKSVCNGCRASLLLTGRAMLFMLDWPLPKMKVSQAREELWRPHWWTPRAQLCLPGLLLTHSCYMIITALLLLLCMNVLPLYLMCLPPSVLKATAEEEEAAAVAAAVHKRGLLPQPCTLPRQTAVLMTMMTHVLSAWTLMPRWQYLAVHIHCAWAAHTSCAAAPRECHCALSAGHQSLVLNALNV